MRTTGRLTMLAAACVLLAGCGSPPPDNSGGGSRGAEPLISILVVLLMTALLVVIECWLPAETSSRRLTQSQIGFRNKIALGSMIGIVGLAAISALTQCATTSRINPSLAGWLFSLALIGINSLSYMTFVLAIVRYRSRYAATVFTLLCCGAVTFLNLALFSEIRSSSEPSLELFAMLPVLSAVVGFLCLICLRVGEFVGGLLTENGNLPLLSLPKRKAVQSAIGCMLGGAITSVFVWNMEPASTSERLNAFVTGIMLPYCCGAFGSGSIQVWLLAFVSTTIFAMTVLNEKVRSRTIAKLSFSAFMSLSLLTLWFDGYIVAMFNPVLSSEFAEAAAETIVTGLINQLAFPLDMIVTIFWSVLWMMVLRALDAELSDTVQRPVTVRPAGYRNHSFSVRRMVPVFKAGGASFLINLVAVTVWTGILALLAGSIIQPGRDLSFDISMTSFFAALNFCPVVGVVALSALQAGRFPSERVLGWETAERASRHCLAHIVMALLIWLLFGFLMASVLPLAL